MSTVVKLSKQQKRDLKRAAQVQAGSRERKPKKQRHNGRGSFDSREKVEEKAVVPLSVYKRENFPVEPLSAALNVDPSTILYANDAHFDQVLQHSYDTFVHEPASTFKNTFHTCFKSALSELSAQGVYKHDLVQPFGLGGKIAKTFVERILVGQPGITYKYLGSRMFAYPWEGTHANPAMKVIGKANETLKSHTHSMLQQRGLSETGHGYNLTLINKCYPDKTSAANKDREGKKGGKRSGKERQTRRKDRGEGGERGEDQGKREGKSDDGLPYAVSWHADSSLDHFSSIGVLNYLCTDEDQDDNINKNDEDYNGNDNGPHPGRVAHKGGLDDWKLALRVANNIEGPSRGERRDTTDPGPYAPPIVVDIKDNESYFLLDSFNHHHQHAVVAGDTVRYSSTHRVSRVDGHTYDYVNKKCLMVLNAALSCAPKALRYEHEVYNEIEFEWIRPFYYHGQYHYDTNVWWHHPIQTLLGYLQRFEERCEKQGSLLRAAVREKIGGKESEEGKVPPLSSKDKKRLATVASESYTVFCEALTARVEKRRLWMEKYADTINASMLPSQQPVSSIPWKKPLLQVERWIEELATHAASNDEVRSYWQ